MSKTVSIGNITLDANYPITDSACDGAIIKNFIKVSMNDIILLLQIISNVSHDQYDGVKMDINNDSQFQLNDLIYLLKLIAE